MSSDSAAFDPVLIQCDPLRSQVEIPDEAVRIDCAVRSAGTVRVPEQVIHPVHIEITMNDS